jgi:hypothetical protein
MRDLDIRKALGSDVLKRHERNMDTLVLHELGLRHGAARVDIAVVNGILHGYEIKSDADTLERLPKQIDVYNRVLDKATLVVGRRHADRAIQQIPFWWGVKIASQGPRGGISFREERPCKFNPSVDPIAVAELLWRSEVLETLRELRIQEKHLRKPRSDLYRDLASMLSIDELREKTRNCLKRRENWRYPQRLA